MPRESKTNGATSEKEQNQWVMIVEESVLQAGPDDSQPTFQTLRHPKSDELAMYLFPSNLNGIYEVQKFDENHRSWFIGDTVQSDGGLYLPSPVDPVFLVLPYLQKAAKGGKFIPLDQIVVDEEATGCNRLCQCLEKVKLDMVADVRGDDDFKAFRYNQGNTLKWLKRKVQVVAKALASQSIDITSGAHAAIYQQSSKSSAASEEDHIRYAHGIVSDYISISLSQELKEHMGIKAPVREKPDIEEPPAKKAKKGSLEPTEDYSQANAQSKGNHSNTKQTAAQTKLSKVDKSGMKSLASFFSAKPKAKK